MRKKKIVQLVEDLKTGGLERVIVGLATHLDRERYELQVWCIVRGGNVLDELIAKGVDVRVLQIKGYYNPLNVFRLAGHLRKEQIDILQCHGYFASVIGRLAGLCAGTPFMITHIHTLFSKMTPRNVFIDKFLNRFTKKIVFISEAARHSFLYAGYAIAGKAVVIYNGIEPPLPDGLEADSEPGVILVVASLFAHKGHTFLLQAMAQVVRDFPEARLWIIGEGPLHGDLAAEAVRLGIEDTVTFFGLREDVYRYLDRSSVVVLPSLREGLGIAAIEALSRGRPVVASNVGGLPEVITDGENGYLVPPGDAGALAEKLILLLKDDRKRKEMGEKGREVFLGKFTVERMVREVEELCATAEGLTHG